MDWCGPVYLTAYVSTANFPDFRHVDTEQHQSNLPPFVDIGGSELGVSSKALLMLRTFAWVHHQALQTRENPKVQKYSTVRTD